MLVNKYLVLTFFSRLYTLIHKQNLLISGLNPWTWRPRKLKFSGKVPYNMLYFQENLVLRMFQNTIPKGFHGFKVCVETIWTKHFFKYIPQNYNMAHRPLKSLYFHQSQSKMFRQNTVMISWLQNAAPNIIRRQLC